MYVRACVIEKTLPYNYIYKNKIEEKIEENVNEEFRL